MVNALGSGDPLGRVLGKSKTDTRESTRSLLRNSPAQRSLARRKLGEFLTVWRAEPALCGLLRNSPAQRSLARRSICEFLVVGRAEPALRGLTKTSRSNTAGSGHRFQEKPIPPRPPARPEFDRKGRGEAPEGGHISLMGSQRAVWDAPLRSSRHGVTFLVTDDCILAERRC